MTRDRVAITCPQLQRTLDDHREVFDRAGVDLLVPPVIQQLSEEELMELLPTVDGIIIGDDPMSAAVLGRAHRLRIISKWGVGVDSIDLEAAAELGIRVTNTPGMFGDEVADVVIGYLVMLARQLHRVDSAVRAGEWAKVEGVSLAGRTLGIVGLGAIGRAVAVRALSMGMRVLGTEVAESSAMAAREIGVEVVDRLDLLTEADVVSLNCPLTRDNRHMLDEAAFRAMKAGVWVINTARGPLIDERALVDALARGSIAGAALDVFEIEPLPMDSPLRRMDNVILGAHNSSNTLEAVHRTSVRAIENLLVGLAEVRR